ncbi:non-heme chloroperoxidase [Tahibacter aquaticus]|uniref:Non-heme chloroperoxidase n=2 Tax=Tahibacter aquaticus TaxID=520092 RepID=A0A4R6Z0G1_9GAMM|nr:non-heme chloroperoxidase [Tahibacter aquaticus]
MSTPLDDDARDTIDAQRRALLAATAAAVGAGIAWPLLAGAATPASPSHPKRGKETSMTTISSKDGTAIYYSDWGKGRPIVFSHGWPLTGDAWEAQRYFFASNGFRAIAHDRRGHGRSGQPWDGNDMDTYADDLAALIEKLDLKDAVLVGHSTGGGEVAHYLGRHGTARVSKAVLVSAVPPVMVKSASNPDGVPKEAFDQIRAGVLADRSGFYRDLASGPFFGFNRPDAKKQQGLIDSFWLQGMAGGLKGQYDCIKQFSEVDYSEDLKKIDIPTLVLHGDDDQIVPIANAAQKSVKLLKKGTLKVYKGGSHALPNVNADEVNADILAFIKS